MPSSTTQMWLGSSGKPDAVELVVVVAAGAAALLVVLTLLRRAVGHHQQAAAHQHQRSCSPQALSLVGDCFARTGGAPDAPPQPRSSSALLLGVSRLRQFLAGRPTTLEMQHRQALSLARARARTTGGGGASGSTELSLLNLLDRDFSPSDFELLSRLDEAVDTSSRFGATQVELERLPLRTVGGGGDEAAKKGAEAVGVCCICLESWAPGETQRTLPCLHFFHAQCVDPWLTRRFQCPLCQTPF
jgi:hypothetical protein